MENCVKNFAQMSKKTYCKGIEVPEIMRKRTRICRFASMAAGKVKFCQSAGKAL